MKTNLLKTLGRTILLGLTLGALPMAAPGYEYGTTAGGDVIKWYGDDRTLHAASDQFTLTSPYREALEEAVDAWSLNPSEFRVYVEFDTTWYELGNELNEIWFSNDESLLSGAPAITYSWYNTSTGGRIEADVLFDEDHTWTTSDTKTDTLAYGGDRSFQGVALHELGHVLGLKHEDAEYNIMGQDWDHVNANADRICFYPGENAVDGLVDLYGLDSNPVREDVGVVHWKHSGSSDGYSTHTRTEIYDTSDTALDFHNDSNGEPVYEVKRGHTILMEITLENNGTTSQSPLVHFVWSSNDLITTADTFLEDRRPTVHRNRVYVITQELVIPSDATKGSIYYLGAIIDADDSIDEVNEQNNATYIAVEIK